MEQCPDDEEVRNRVASMLHAYDSDDTFLESPLKNFGERYASSRSHESLVGTKVGPYLIRRVIAQGGMGVVFEALDTNLEKIVALKMMNPALMQDLTFKRRFEQEAKTLAKLEDPHFVRVYALIEENHNTFIVMEYINGYTLAEHIRGRGNFSPREVARVGLQLLTALSKAHKQNIIHRDLKPSNIMLTKSDDGRMLVKVLDFGIAKNVQGSNAITRTMGTVGTLYYMSPEQIRALPDIDHRTDVYSAGVTLYEALNGTLPFDITKDEFTIRKQIVEGGLSARLASKRLPENSVEKVLAQAMDIDPARRFQSADQMRAALLAAIRAYNPETIPQPEAQHPGAPPVAPAGPIPLAPKKKRGFPRYAIPLVGLLIFVPLLLYAMRGNISFLQPAPAGTENPISESELPAPGTSTIPPEIPLDTLDTSPEVLPSDPLPDTVAPITDEPVTDINTPTVSTVDEPSDTPDIVATPPEDSAALLASSDSIFSSLPDSSPEPQDETPVVQPPVQYGSITLFVGPPGNLIVDNVDFGSVVVESLNLTADYHRFVIQNRDYGTWECTLEIPPNQPIEKNIFFDQPVSIPVVAMLPDSTIIRNASILIDGSPTGFETPQTVQVFPGLHSFGAELEGYTQESVQIDGAEGCFQKVNDRINFDNGVNYRDKRVIIVLRGG